MNCPLLPQERSVRQFLLTNLVEQNGHYAWRVNLEAISAHLESIMSFPNFENSYEGPTLFLGGASSAYIRYKTPQTQTFYCLRDKCINIEYILKVLQIRAFLVLEDLYCLSKNNYAN